MKKRTVLVMAVVALVVGLLPGILGASPATTAPSETLAPLGTPQPDSFSPDQNVPLLAAPALTDAADLALVDRLQSVAGHATVATHLQTGRVRFVGADVADPAAFRGVPTGIEGRPEEAGRAFLAEYGSLFGIEDAASLRVKSVESDAPEGVRSFVRYQQTINGIPVLAGELVTQVDKTGAVWSASGEARPEADTAALPTEAKITPDAAAQIALAATAKYEEYPVEGLTASQPALWYYAPELLGRPSLPTQLVWRIEVTPVDLSPIRELVLVDAVTGQLALHFNQIAHAKTRTVYDNQNNRGAGLPGWGPARGEGQGATGNADVDKAYDFAGDTYDFFMSRHNRDSIDGGGMGIISTVRYCPSSASVSCPYENAFWNGKQMVYGAGYASADDVVGHELTHGVTDYESQLFYYMQSGALNESFSDIWGEYIDQVNGKGNDAASAKWLMGEDVPGGAIRSMANPGAYGDPDRVGSSRYWCDLRDDGGVHINSGVPNKAAFLMTDGGSFNGKTVAALGLEKTVRIWYRMATLTLTSGGEFQDAYDLLPQACSDLAGSGTGGITAADCQQVRNALDATQMNLQPASCASTQAPVCAAGEAAQVVHNETFENQSQTLGRWAATAAVGPVSWYYPQTSNPYGYGDLHYSSSGLWHLWAVRDELTDSSMEMANGVGVPANGKPFMRFKHAYEFEYESGGKYYDGGVLEYSTNGGPWTDAGTLFTHNGYDGTITSPVSPFNPLKGRKAFIAESWGYQSSRLDLSSFKGQSIRFRWRLGADGDFAAWSWFVDDVQIYTCLTAAPPTPTPSPTPNTPWLTWATNALPPASLNPMRPARVLYGNVGTATEANATISGGAVFGNDTTSQSKPVAAGSGEIFFNVKAKPGAAPGTSYTLQVKMGSVTISRTGKVAREVKLPVLLK